MRLSVSVARSVTRLHFFLVDTLSSASFFSFFPLHLSGSSPAPPLPSQSFCLSAFADPTIFSSSAICTSLSSSLCLLVCSGRDWGLYWGDEIGRCLPGSLLSQTVHFSVSAKHWNSQDECRVVKIAKKNYISLKILSRFGSDVVWFLSSKLCGVRGLKLSWNSLVIMPSKSVRSCSSFKMRLNAGESSDYALFKAL